MKKTIFVAFSASILYFIIYIVLKFSLHDAVLDWQNALSGATVFWLFIFLVHHLLERGRQVPL